MTVHFQTRSHTYRNRVGFLIVGRGQGIYRTRIFTESRSSAEYIRAQLRADPGYQTRVEDFKPRD